MRYACRHHLIAIVSTIFCGVIACDKKDEGDKANKPRPVMSPNYQDAMGQQVSDGNILPNPKDDPVLPPNDEQMETNPQLPTSSSNGNTNKPTSNSNADQTTTNTGNQQSNNSGNNKPPPAADPSQTTNTSVSTSTAMDTSHPLDSLPVARRQAIASAMRQWDGMADQWGTPASWLVIDIATQTSTRPRK